MLPAVPPIQPLSAWTPDDVYRHISDGSPGPDAISGEFFYLLSDDALAALTSLLNAADDGLVPKSWSEARLVLIPKPESPNEKRPLTILNISYRIWAKRHASHLNAWIDSWAHPGLVGARIAESAADTALRVSHAVNMATASVTDPKYIIKACHPREA